MGIILIWAGKAGRQSDALNAILFSAVLMVFFNPYILLYDIGFQLSFAATFGIVFLAPRWSNFLKFLGPVFGPNTSATIAAQIFTLPLIVIYFGRISLIAPMANLLILPIIPYIMFFGILAALTAFVSFYLAKIIAVFLWLMINYVIGVLKSLAVTRFASLEYKISDWYLIFAYYVLLFEYLIIRTHHTRLKLKQVLQKPNAR
jgi:competence protein ComEC